MATNKEMQKKRMMSYFIIAAQQIIQEEGIKAVTIRKVAALAGYNSATIYNYFENLENLLFFASMKYLRDYSLGVSDYIKDCTNSMERFFKVWEYFSHYSFAHSEVFHHIFFNKYNNTIGSTIKAYYDIFPEDLGEHESIITDMLKGENIYERNKILLHSLVTDGYLREEHFENVNILITACYQTLLYENTQSPQADISQKRMLEMIDFILKTCA